MPAPSILRRCSEHFAKRAVLHDGAAWYAMMDMADMLNAIDQVEARGGQLVFRDTPSAPRKQAA